MNASPVRPALRYHGGKWKLAKWIISHFPPHTAYVEPYGGGASVLLRKQPSTIDVYNDLDGRVVNFFKMLRERPDDLIRAIELTPYSREELKLTDSPIDCDELEAARHFYVRSWQGFGSPTRKRSIGWAYQKDFSLRVGTRLPQWNATSHLWEVASRLKGVYIECDDALRVIRRFDGPETLHYVDPPYLRSLRNSGHFDYAHEMTEAQHRGLAETLRGIRGMTLLSGYPSPLYAELYPDWVPITRHSVDMKGAKRFECLWLSPSAIAHARQLHLDLGDEETS